ncbi:hypothetical protein EW146_g6056 [Bondarzewia mesenterica]|uniref:Uncharacterized protein n=1 Tax=Bondarzewia mesenterica TaxID=1095465 RepID=A0A4V6S1E6_9AGAM|nr:hypothetical protein EW146_g6056 [Bondarzewia mesenterica]
MSITITIDTVQQVVQQLGLSDKVDFSALYQALERQALTETRPSTQTTLAPPLLDPQQRTTLVSGKSMTPGEPVPPYSSKAAPATLDTDEVTKRRNLVERAKSDFKGTIPTAFVIMSPPEPSVCVLPVDHGVLPNIRGHPGV